MKNLLSLLCALVLSVSAAALPVNADESGTYEDAGGNVYKYHINSFGAAIDKIEVKDAAGELIIPAEIEDAKVYLISDYAFDKSGRSKVNKIRLESDTARFKFTDMETLTEVSLPDGLAEIGDSCFRGCSNLKEVTIPDTVKRIGHMAFMDCASIESIVIPDSVEYIGQEAFHGCASLVKIDWNGKSELHDNVFTGTPYLRDGRNDCIITDNGKTLYSWGGKSKVVEIPEGVTAIAHGAFMESDIEKVICPRSMTTISNMAFYEAKSLKEVEFKGDVTEFEPSAFGYCSSLSKLNIPATVTKIPEACFNYCTSLTEIEIPDTVTEMAQYAFFGCKNVKTLKLSENCSVIPWGCFGQCTGLTQVTIPDHVERIENEAFAQCSELSVVNMGSDVKVETDAFKQTPYGEEKGLPETTIKPIEKVEPAATRKPKAASVPVEETTSKPEPEIEGSPTSVPIENGGVIEVKSGDALTVEVNGDSIRFPDAKPYIDNNGRTQIPIRAVAEGLGCEVDWDAATRTAVIKRGDDVVYITIGKDTLQIGSTTVQMDTAAEIRDDRTYIPVRFVGEALGMQVNWVEEE